MNNRINIYGTLMVDVDCECCGMSETIEAGIDQNDWLNEYDVDVTIWSDKIKNGLIHEGWEEVDGKFVCPDCVEELKGE